MSKHSKTKLVPNLWYAKDAEEAARFYARTFPDSSVDKVVTMPADSPSGPAGSVTIVELTVLGTPLVAMTAGPHHEFNDAISFAVHCESQAELDRYWNAILENGGKPQACGWIIDRYGVRWQIVPSALGDLLAHSDRTKAKRATEEMLKQVKIDIAKIEAAFDGR
jgi:predicted 3-demethylubiquinone-9 3-methyltransferase (glyoxalase superfamily)